MIFVARFSITRVINGTNVLNIQTVEAPARCCCWGSHKLVDLKSNDWLLKYKSIESDFLKCRFVELNGAIRASLKTEFKLHLSVKLAGCK